MPFGFIRRGLADAIPNQPADAGGGAAPPSSPADAGTSPPAAAPTAAPAAAPSAPDAEIEQWRDPKAIKRLAERNHRLEDKVDALVSKIEQVLKPPAAPQASPPAQPDDRLASVEVRQGWADARDLLDELSLTPSSDQAKKLKAAFLRERPTDVTKWVDEWTSLLGIQPKAQPSAPPAAPVPGASMTPPPAAIRTDLGAPGRKTTPTTRSEIPADEWAAMTYEQRKEIRDKELGSKRSPFWRPLPGQK